MRSYWPVETQVDVTRTSKKEKLDAAWKISLCYGICSLTAVVYTKKLYQLTNEQVAGSWLFNIDFTTRRRGS